MNSAYPNDRVLDKAMTQTITYPDIGVVLLNREGVFCGTFTPCGMLDVCVLCFDSPVADFSYIYILNKSKLYIHEMF